MTVHHHRPNHHVAALSGIALANGGNGLNLSRMSANLEAHHHHHHHQPHPHHRGLEGLVERNGAAAAAAAAALGLDRLANGLDARNGANPHIGLGINIHSGNGAGGASLERADAATTMPHRSRFMITDILAGASSPSSQEPPGSPPSTPRDLSVRHQSRSSLNNSTVDEDSDASHHDTVSVSSNGEFTFFFFFCFLSRGPNKCL